MTDKLFIIAELLVRDRNCNNWVLQTRKSFPSGTRLEDIRRQLIIDYDHWLRSYPDKRKPVVRIDVWVPATLWIGDIEYDIPDT